jgi:hypothetical protein
MPHPLRIPRRLRADFDPKAQRLQTDLIDADDQRRAAETTLTLIGEHYKFIDGQQRREMAVLDGRSNWRTTTMTLLLGAFGLSLQRVTSADANLSADAPGWTVAIVTVAIGYLIALTVGVIATLNVGRGEADDLAMDAQRNWDRLISMAPEDVRYDITKSLATACVNSQHLLSWKRTWNRRATIALMLQAACVVAMAIIQVGEGV